MNVSGRGLLVAIDGPAGAGKSTLARRVAARLGMRYLDTGALYRAIAFYLHSREIPPSECPVMEKALEGVTLHISEKGLLLNGTDVGAEIRSPLVDSIVSPYAALPAVRRRLLAIQREQGKMGGLVADGRDMGTVVFPCADVKIFLTASDEVRADRRLLELQGRGEDICRDEVLKAIRERDRIDSGRASAPLRKAEDAVEIDTGGLSIEEVEEAILEVIHRRRKEMEARS